MSNSRIGRRIDGARNRLHPSFVVWITLLWLLLMGEVSVANVVGGLAVALAIVLFLPLPAMPVAETHISWGKLVLHQVVWVVELLQASVKVAWLALRPEAPPKTAILAVPMRVESELVLSYAVLLYNLQPGGAVTDIDIANRMLTIHVLDAPNEDAIEREIAAVATLERRMIEIFERKRGV